MLVRGSPIIGIGAVLAIGAIGYMIRGAVQQIGYLSPPDAASRATHADPMIGAEALREERDEAATPAPVPTQVNRPIIRSDPVRERFEADTSTLPRWDESPDDRESLQDLRDDPDPDVRAEAAALLELLDAELALSNR